MAGVRDGGTSASADAGGTRLTAVNNVSEPVVTREPILAVDVGTVVTRAYLLELVAGSRRLVSIGECSTLGDDGLPDVGGHSPGH